MKTSELNNLRARIERARAAKRRAMVSRNVGEEYDARMAAKAVADDARSIRWNFKVVARTDVLEVITTALAVAQS